MTPTMEHLRQELLRAAGDMDTLAEELEQFQRDGLLTGPAQQLARWAEVLRARAGVGFALVARAGKGEAG